MKIKVPSGGGGVKTILANHGEKLIFGIICLGSLYLVFAGIGASQVIEPKKSPSDLRNIVSQAKTHLDGFTWDANYKQDRDKPQRYSERVDDLSQPVVADGYKLSQYLKPPYIPPRSRRRDPVLLPPESLRVESGRGVLAVKKLPPGARDVQDFVPNSAEVRGASEAFITIDSEAKGRGVYFVSLTAVVPMRKQLQAYNDALGNSEGYKIERDQPICRGFAVERAEVKGDPSAPMEWKRVGASYEVLAERSKDWAGTVNPTNPFCPPKCEDPNNLTMPLPPIRGVGGLDAWTRLAGHPLIQVLPPAGAPATTPATPESGTPTVNGFETPAVATTGSGSGQHGAQPSGAGGPEVKSQQLSERDKLLSETPDYKLLRYFDLNVEPGRVYRYRVILAYEDPNNPPAGTEKPSHEALEQEVVERIQQIPRDQKVTVRMTAASDPSPAVRVRSGHQTLAGAAIAPAAIPQRGTTDPIRGIPETYNLPRNEISAQIVALQFDVKSAIQKAIKVAVQRGFVLNGRQNVLVTMPLTGRNGTVEGTAVRTDTVILDIRGGETIGNTKLTEPARILSWTADGAFDVSEEINDLSDFQSYPFVDEEAEKEAAKAAAAREAEKDKKENRKKTPGGRNGNNSLPFEGNRREEGRGR